MKREQQSTDWSKNWSLNKGGGGGNCITTNKDVRRSHHSQAVKVESWNKLLIGFWLQGMQNNFLFQIKMKTSNTLWEGGGAVWWGYIIILRSLWTLALLSLMPDYNSQNNHWEILRPLSAFCATAIFFLNISYDFSDAVTWSHEQYVAYMATLFRSCHVGKLYSTERILKLNIWILRSPTNCRNTRVSRNVLQLFVTLKFLK